MVSQKLVSSSPMDQIRDGSWRESLKAPLMSKAACVFKKKKEGKIAWMNRGNSTEKSQGYASPWRAAPMLGLCCWLIFQSSVWDCSVSCPTGAYPCPQLCAGVPPGSSPAAG